MTAMAVTGHMLSSSLRTHFPHFQQSTAASRLLPQLRWLIRTPGRGLAAVGIVGQLTRLQTQAASAEAAEVAPTPSFTLSSAALLGVCLWDEMMHLDTAAPGTAVAAVVRLHVCRFHPPLLHMGGAG
jgi:hypothetical protein